MPTGGASSGGASSGAIRAGSAYVEAFLKDNKLIRGLEGLRRRFSAFGGMMMGVGGKAAAAGTLLATPILAAVSNFASTGDALNKMSQRTGVSVETLSELAYAAGQSGSSLEELGVGMKGMAKFTDAVAGGSQEAAKQLDDLGISAKEFMASSPEKRFEMLADGIDSIADPQLKAAAAMTVFGKVGEGMLPMLEGGTEAIAGLRKEAQSLGKTVTKEQAEAATRLGDAWDRVKAAAMSAVFAVGGALAPTLEMVAGHLKSVAVNIGNFVRNNLALVRILGGVVVGLFAASAASFIFGGVLKVLSFTLSLVSAGVSILATALSLLPLLLSPIGIVVAAIAGFGTAFLLATNSGKRFVTRVGAFFGVLKDTAVEGWGGIAAAIESGDLELAFQIASSGIKIIWLETVAFLKDEWKRFRDGFVQGLKETAAEIGKWFKGILKDAVSSTAGQWLTVGGMVKKIRSGKEPVAGLSNVAGQFAPMESVADAEKPKSELDLERERFKALIQKAKDDLAAIRAEKNKAIEPDRSFKGSPGPPMVEKLQMAADSARGAFSSSNWKGAFALGDKVQQKQLRVQEQIRDGVAGVGKKLDNVEVMRIN